jgi:hypothetical protein
MALPKIIDIRSGREQSVGYVETLADDREYFWSTWDLRKDGKPDRRAKSHAIGVRKSQYGDYLNGHYARLDPVREIQGNTLRRRVATLEAQLSEARRALSELYLVKS